MATIEEKVKKFWDQQAVEHGASDIATAPDHQYRRLEIRSILPHIRGPRVLDVGCGNGYSTIKFKEAYPDYTFLGVDYSKRMIAEARLAGPNIAFEVADVRNLSYDIGLDIPYDTIISERCLINLMTWEEQKAAIYQMAKCLAPGGWIILVENFKDGLDNLNELRVQRNLEPIQVRWHNRYMTMDEIIELADDFNVLHRENIGNLYYILSRVVYAKLAAWELEEPSYDHPINQIASTLPTLGQYMYSPNMLYVLERT